ncbi:MAG: rhomboid family intramembrane serine protease [Proteobacteria bacterium]|nr:rhomboid family intramembrane serine protease [Pseudomonadota bacterium]
MLAQIRRAPAALVWGLSIVAAFALVAADLDQPLTATQHSRDLTAYGVFKGRDLEVVESWRLLASQWLHVKPKHMLFNAVIIAVVGGALESRLGVWPFLTVGLIGGALGQLAGAWAYPHAFISGASQAYLALCGLALLTLRPRQRAWWVAVLGVVVAVGLDLFVSSHAGLKAGHVVGFLTGIAAGLALRWSRAGGSPDGARLSARFQ